MPLAEASALLPKQPGVLQVRVARGLLDYPRGRSAMVRYLATPDLASAAAALATAHPDAPWWCRASEEVLALDEATRACAALLAMFVQRFGAGPGAPGEDR